MLSDFNSFFQIFNLTPSCNVLIYSQSLKFMLDVFQKIQTKILHTQGFPQENLLIIQLKDIINFQPSADLEWLEVTVTLEILTETSTVSLLQPILVPKWSEGGVSMFLEFRHIKYVM